MTGYFRAPMRMSWGPAVTTDTNAIGPSIRARSCARRRWCPTRTTSTGATPTASSAPWTELNFKYGNDRVKAQVQIASYNLTDSGLPPARVEPGHQPGVHPMLWPELARPRGPAPVVDRRRLHQPLRRGGPLRRRQIRDVPVRPHARRGPDRQRRLRRQRRLDAFRSRAAAAPSWSRFRSTARPGAWRRRRAAAADVGAVPGAAVRRSRRFLLHGHLGAVCKKQLILGAHFIDVFSNDNERSTAYTRVDRSTLLPQMGQRAAAPATTAGKPRIMTYGVDAKLLGGVLGDGYLGYSRLDARNALYLRDAIEVHPLVRRLAAARQLLRHAGRHRPGARARSTPCCSSTRSASGQLFYYPAPFWGQGPDLIASVFGMFNHVDRAAERRVARRWTSSSSAPT